MPTADPARATGGAWRRRRSAAVAARALWRRALRRVLPGVRRRRGAGNGRDELGSLTPLSVRRLVGQVSLAVALLAALSPPIGYIVTGHLNAARTLTFKTAFCAERLSHYVSEHGVAGESTHAALLRAFSVIVARDEGMRQRILASDGTAIAEQGRINGPAQTRTALVTVNGAAIGRLEVTASLMPLISETALIALASLLLGIVVYLAGGRLPLRALDRVIRELQKRKRELRTQNMWFNAALNNMSQGLCMFDADKKLVVANQRWAEIYGLGPEHVKPGTPFVDIIEDRIRTGIYAGNNPEQYVRERCAAVMEGKASTKIQELKNGRVIVISHRPMPDGGWVATHEDITEQRRIEARMAHMAHHDTLTDLPNRALLRERIDEALLRADRGESFAVLMLDLDRFKSINDTLGHPVGDELLFEVASRLRGCVRESDTVARLGGDEFAVVQLARELPQEAAALATRIIDELREPFNLTDHHVTINTSIGIAIAPLDGSDPDQLMNNADVALYRAKEEGRGIYRFFEPYMDTRLKERRALEFDLREALAHGEFEVFYQPVVRLETQTICGFEALARWRHPMRGMVAPDDFIPVAEDIGVVVGLGEWVLRQACMEAATWTGGQKVAVNLSPAQFQSGNLVQMVMSALAASGLAPPRLELEITESVLLQDNAATLDMLHQLRRLGVRIAMDDFGTGYSSLSYLRSFPFDKIKIDRSFVQGLGEDDDSVAIVRAVVGLSRRLGIDTTAEGVETQEQLDQARSLGCTEMQGFLCSPPRPAAEIRELFLTEKWTASGAA